MTKREAYQAGKWNGESAAEDCAVHLDDHKAARCLDHAWPGECDECLSVAAADAEQNARQYADHVPDGMTEAQWEAYDAGVAAGIKAGVAKRLKARG